jgi:galactose oxidase-like protein
MKKLLSLLIFLYGSCLLTGCGAGNTTPPLAITVDLSPNSAQALDVNQSLPITANVSNDPSNQGFDWALACGGSNCGTITAHTASGSLATFVAPGSAPSTSVTITARLTGRTNSATTKITVSVRPTVATAGAIASATLGSPYGLQLTANGGAGTLTWALGVGTSLPDTLSLSGTGMITGTPSGAIGPFNFKVHVTDSGSPPLTSPDVPLNITVGIGTSPISVALSPTSAFVALNGSTKFVATVTNDQPNGNVDWTLTLNGLACSVAECGSVSPITTMTGALTTYTAPANVPTASIALIATTVDGTPPATATATVTVGTQRFVPTVGSMESARSYHTATLIGGGNVLIAGGIDSAGKALASAELFDFTGLFTPTVSMQIARSRHTATLLNDGRVLLTGGLDSNSHPLASAELLDPAHGTVTPTQGNMNSPRAYHTATLLADGTVLVTGGFDGTNGLATAELFDPANGGTFTPTKGSMESPRFDHTATLLEHGPALTNGKVLVTGGSKLNRTQYATAELFDPANGGTFTPTQGHMETSRAFHTATLLIDGTVLVTGGLVTVARNTYADLATAELFDPANGGMFTPTQSSLNFARDSHTATLLNDGTVLVTGGFDRNTALATAELFNPTGTFLRTADMATPRANHTATLLTNGAVLVTGGVDGRGTPLATAELYQ